MKYNTYHEIHITPDGDLIEGTNGNPYSYEKPPLVGRYGRLSGYGFNGDCDNQLSSKGREHFYALAERCCNTLLARYGHEKGHLPDGFRAVLGTTFSSSRESFMIIYPLITLSIASSISEVLTKSKDDVDNIAVANRFTPNFLGGLLLANSIDVIHSKGGISDA